MIYDIKENLKNFFSSRLFVVSVVMIVLFSLLLFRAFSLQVINGASYQENFTLYIQRTLTKDAARGNIYDRNGKLLAGNVLSYSVELADSGNYESTKVKNPLINEEIATIVTEIRKNGESIVNDFQIDLNEDGTYSFNVSGTALKRFLADAFGRASYDALKINKLGFNEATATADQVMEYLMSDSCYNIGEEYDQRTAYEIVVIRYALKAYSFTRYQTITIAENVSDKTVAFMNEHSDELIGVSVQEETVRRYYESEYFASMIGYTGKISDSEYEKLHEEDSSYSTNDVIGKAGLEQFYESYLRGINGEEEVYVNNVGKISQVISSKDPVAGNDLYLTIDADLQKAVYYLLEQEIAGIVYSNIKSGNIPIEDVYFALVNNNIIDIMDLDAEDAGPYEAAVFRIFTGELDQSLDIVRSQLTSSDPQTNNDMSEETLDYFTYVMSLLKNDKILPSGNIDTADSTYQKWRNGNLSPKEYLNYCISKQWVDISLLEVDEKYADSSEVYDALCNYILTEAAEDKDFAKIVYKYLIKDGSVTGRQLCLILFEQGVLEYDDNAFQKLEQGTTSPSSFLLNKINKIEITPAQLALDPCTGSCVLTDVNSGEILALVSYPGYDNNQMANGVDAEYFASLQDDKSNPLYNYATQEKTAPGSTFKMISATAGLAEGLIDTSSKIKCTGIFKEVSNEPKCWIYPGSHGTINVSEALRDSCNVFFYTLGYRMAGKATGTYDDSNGIELIQKYASIYGLNEKTGLEIEENTPNIATEYPVMAAIGQSNNNFTTVSLSRYVTAVTSGKLYNYQLMSKIVSPDGEVMVSHNSEYEDISNTLTKEQWDAVHKGMRMVCEDLDSFKNFDIAVAGKTGTAQQVETRPNHALFVGYAPYEDPKVSIAVRIAYGYTSHNAAAVAEDILSYYFGKSDLDSILSQKAEDANGSTTTSVTD